MKRIAFLFFCLFVPFSPAEETTPTKYAVLIGIDDYVRLLKLRYSKNDIEALRDRLLGIGFEKENVFSLTCGGRTKDLPTKEHIEVVLETVFDLAKEGDIVVLAMCGHGIEVGDQARFCPIDTKENDLVGTTIAISDVFEKFSNSKATFKLMLVDACRENPFHGRSVADASVLSSLADPPKGIMLLQSCAKDEISYEDETLRHGVFTHFLLEGLDGKAANREGKITLLGLSSYVIEQTQRRVLSEYRARQRPYLRGEITDFVLREAKTIQVAPEVSVTSIKPEPAPRPFGTSESSRKAGERMVLPVKGVEYAFRWCPAGTFTMGSPEGELGGYSSLEKQHQVTLTRGFWMLETEVTQAMWKGITGDNPSHFKGDKLPVENVSWEDCQKFIEQLNELRVAPSGYRFSLPTEAQWEYACRAGTTTALNSGKNLTDEKYNCPNLNELGWYDWQGENKTTHAVGQKKSNAWGLFDMHGNVYEWCLDWYGGYPNGSVTDPTGAFSGSDRVLRGGCWYDSARHCRSANRGINVPSYRYSYFGVRLALVRVE